jgi:hypothetical protein
MACNCATKEQIEKLHSLYGQKVNPDIPTTLKFKIKKFSVNLGVYLSMILIFPILIMILIYHAFIKRDNKISIRKILGLKGHKTLDNALAKTIIENTNIAETNV